MHNPPAFADIQRQLNVLQQEVRMLANRPVQQLHIREEQRQLLEKQATSSYFAQITIAGTPKLVNDGPYLYRFSDWNRVQRNPIGYYKCVNVGCRMRIHVDQAGNISQPASNARYCHCGFKCTEESWKLDNKMRELMETVRHEVEEKALDRNKRVDDIYTELLEEMRGRRRDGEQTILVTKVQLTNWVRKARGPVGRDVDTLEDLKKVMIGGQERTWLRVNSLVPKYVIFALEENLNELRRCRLWLIDGTFQSAPMQYHQLLNVMGVDDSGSTTYTPCIHVLMHGSDKESYINVLLKLMSSIVNVRMPQITVMIDFETAMKNALREVGQRLKLDIRVRGCLFHFAQAIYRWFQKKLDHAAANSVNGKRMLFYCLWLPYVETMTAQSFLRELETRETGPLDAVAIYLRRQWFSCFDWWHADDLTANIYTNCAIESFHGRLNRELPGAHPTIRALSEILASMDRNEMNKTNMARETAARDDKFMRKCATYREASHLIQERMMAFAMEFPVRTGSAPKTIVKIKEINERKDTGVNENDYGLLSEVFVEAVTNEVALEQWVTSTK